MLLSCVILDKRVFLRVARKFNDLDYKYQLTEEEKKERDYHQYLKEQFWDESH